MTTPFEARRLVRALEALQAAVAACPLPLEVGGVGAARRARRELADQLDDYVLPRLRRLDAPLLLVVGGSTGAGKSTLVNSLVGAEVSAAGVLRPTTRAPVLVHHPDDEGWFADQRILPGLARSTGRGADAGSLRLVADTDVPAGLALLDAPDIDSVVADNRALAAQLLAAADLWLFVTTAARYADAVPWDLLGSAAQRSTAVAVVLDRVGAEATDEVRADLARMLAERGLAAAPVLVVPETELAGGLLPADAVAAVRRWLDGLAADADSRQAVMRRTLHGALDSLDTRVTALAAAADEQAAVAAQLRRDADSAYAAAAMAVDQAVRSGTLLRGEVLARWQEFVGTGELFRTIEAGVGRLRDRIAAVLRARPTAGDVEIALGSSVASLIQANADEAAERATAHWRATPAGAGLLGAADEDLSRSSRRLPDRAADLVRRWQRHVLALVREQGERRRSTARFLSLGVNGVGIALMVAVFAQTGGLTGAEVGVAGGTGLVSQKLLEAVFGDQAVRQLAAEARRDLLARVEGLLGDEARRYHSVLDAAGVPTGCAGQLRQALAAVQRARRDAGMGVAAVPDASAR